MQNKADEIKCSNCGAHLNRVGLIEYCKCRVLTRPNSYYRPQIVEIGDSFGYECPKCRYEIKTVDAVKLMTAFNKAEKTKKVISESRLTNHTD
ncbi:MAG: hypothetical protein NC218_03350 [Acetobacter sp.]|nr:hypothetical protein [Acetobacter sp.]